MEERKREEIEFHNKVRDMALRADEEEFQYYWSNRRFYSITRESTRYYQEWLRAKPAGSQVLDYCCGDGTTSIWLAEEGFQVTGIDISDVSIENCRKFAAERELSESTTFQVMDAEAMEFEDDTFDVIVCQGVLHHLDLEQAMPELARVLKPDGEIICIEALAYNPLIQLYRERTPHLRTDWETEHILSLESLDLARRYFGDVGVRFFHLASLAAVPLRNTPLFEPVLSILELVDSLILRLPAVQTQAWQMVFTLGRPGVPSDQPSFVERQRKASMTMIAALVGIILLKMRRSK